MTALCLLRLLRRTGRIAEPRPATIAAPLPGSERLSGSVNVRYVDAGGGADCGMELQAAFGPVYDLERYGVHLVASPRHADVLLVAGAVTRNMLTPLLRTLAAAPAPRLVVALGDAAISGGPFRGGYGVAGALSDFVPVDLAVPGDPPAPAAIVAALRRIAGR